MAMGRKDRERQDTMWIAAADIARSEGHVFYRALNGLFRRHGFDDFVERLVDVGGHEKLSVSDHVDIARVTGVREETVRAGDGCSRGPGVRDEARR